MSIVKYHESHYVTVLDMYESLATHLLLSRSNKILRCLLFSMLILICSLIFKMCFKDGPSLPYPYVS